MPRDPRCRPNPYLRVVRAPRPERLQLEREVERTIRLQAFARRVTWLLAGIMVLGATWAIAAAFVWLVRR
jgi:hypothetical protein